jgi:UDP-N-acetyl-2-amino-2-deoxyglucuronate dehydrogenase
MAPVGFAIVGCGGMIGGVHAAALKEISEARLVGAWSRSAEKTQRFSEQHQIRGYRSHEELLGDPAVQAVSICLPSGHHADYGVKAAAAGKHVIVEKPIDISISKAMTLIETCRRNNRKLSVIFQSRYTPAAKKVRKGVDQGLLGRLILGDAYIKWYRSPEYYKSNAWRGTKAIDGGGALINQAIHTIDLLQWMMGGVKRLNGLVRTSTHAIESEDLGVATVEYANGAVGVIEGSTAIHPGFKERIEIHGQKGSLTLEGGNITSWKVEGCTEADYVDAQKVTYGSTSSPAISHVNHKAQFEEIVAAIQQDRESLVNGEEGLKALQIVLGIYGSSEKRQWVDL